MKTVELTKISGGEVLAQPVFSNTKELLVPEGVELKKEYIDLLINLGVSHVYIHDIDDGSDKGILLENSVFEEYVKKIKKLLENHTYSGKNTLIKTQKIAEELMDSIDEAMKIQDSLIIVNDHEADLYKHTLSVTIISIILGMKANLEKSQIKNIAEGCILHDLGIRYITVPYTNINIEENDPAEVFEYKKHTILAYTVLESEKWLSKESRNIILSHHEKMDGSGFPLKQKNQDLICKIVQFADAYDCLLTGMECEKRTKEEVKEHFLEKSDTKFDKYVVDLFFENFE